MVVQGPRSNFEITLKSQIIAFSIYKLSDVGISSNLTGLLSLTNGHCPHPGRWIMKQWLAGVNSRFAEVTENGICHECKILQSLTIQKMQRN